MRAYRRRLAGGLVTGAIALGVAGCGSGNLKPASGIDPAYQLLSQKVVDGTAPGPVRTLYQWWLYIQYNDLTDYLRMLTPALRDHEEHGQLIGDELPVASRALAVAVPNIVSVSRTGGFATVYALVAYHQLVGSTRYITVRAPQAFSLVQIGGAWYIADDQFVAEQSRSALVAAGVIPSQAAPPTSTGSTTAANPAATGQPTPRTGTPTTTKSTR